AWTSAVQAGALGGGRGRLPRGGAALSRRLAVSQRALRRRAQAHLNSSPRFKVPELKVPERWSDAGGVVCAPARARGVAPPSPVPARGASFGRVGDAAGRPGAHATTGPPWLHG